VLTRIEFGFEQDLRITRLWSTNASTHTITSGATCRPAEYPWMTDGMEVLRLDFLLGDLKVVTAMAGIAGTVVVEAARRVEETIWLSGVASSDQLIRGVVGWAPLTDPKIGLDLERLAPPSQSEGVCATPSMMNPMTYLYCATISIAG